MAGSLNKVQIIGNLGRDPEIRRTQGGTPVASFSVATTEKYKDKQGNKKEDTEWHNVVLWNRLAEIADKYLKKGSSIYIEGKLKTSSWDDGNTKKYKTEIIGSSIQLLDRANSSGGTGSTGNENSSSYFGEPTAWMTGENADDIF